MSDLTIAWSRQSLRENRTSLCLQIDYMHLLIGSPSVNRKNVRAPPRNMHKKRMITGKKMKQRM